MTNVFNGIDSQAVGDVVLRSTILMLLGLALSKLFEKVHGKQEWLWSTVFVGLILLLAPLPDIDIPIGTTAPVPTTAAVYELLPAWSSGPPTLVPQNAFPVGIALGTLVALGLAWFALKSFATWRLIRTAEQVADKDAVSDLYEVSELLGLPEPPVLLLSDRIQSPCVAGLWNPVLLWPASQNKGISAEDRRLIFAHEVSHLVAKDNWKLAALNLVAALFCWHPLAWVCRSQIVRSIEISCDRRVLHASGVAPASYARLIFGMQSVRAVPATLRMHGQGGTLKRICALEGGKTPKWTPATLGLLALPVLPFQIAPDLSGDRDPARIHPSEVVYFGMENGRDGLFRIWLDGSDPQWMGDTFRGAACPAVSPDGSMIAYTKGVGSERDIYVSDPEGKVERIAIQSPFRDEQPMFSPDGTRLLFFSKTPSGWQTGVHDLETGKTRYLPSSPTGQPNPFQGLEARWHPSGNRILLSSDRVGHQKIWSVDLDGSNPRQLTHGDWEDTGAYFTRSGRYLIYTAYCPWDYNVFRLDLLTGERLQLTHSPALDSEARPTPDGTKILFTTHRTGTPHVAIMNLDGTDQKLLAPQQSSWAAMAGN